MIATSAEVPLFCDAFADSLPSSSTSPDAVSAGYATSHTTSPTEDTSFSSCFPPLGGAQYHPDHGPPRFIGERAQHGAGGKAARRAQNSVVLSASERRARNRLASAKYRQKKSKWEAELLVSHDKLKERCKQLEDVVQVLVRENELLRRQRLSSPGEGSADCPGLAAASTGLMTSGSPPTERWLSEGSSTSVLDLLCPQRGKEQVLHLNRSA